VIVTADVALRVNVSKRPLTQRGYAEGDRARALYAGPEIAVVPAEPPGRTLQSRALRLLPILTLPA
jgi:hypothetical protein